MSVSKIKLIYLIVSTPFFVSSVFAMGMFRPKPKPTPALFVDLTSFNSARASFTQAQEVSLSGFAKSVAKSGEMFKCINSNSAGAIISPSYDEFAVMIPTNNRVIVAPISNSASHAQIFGHYENFEVQSYSFNSWSRTVSADVTIQNIVDPLTKLNRGVLMTHLYQYVGSNLTTAVDLVSYVRVKDDNVIFEVTQSALTGAASITDGVRKAISYTVCTPSSSGLLLL
jgi:hypothetical protein